MGKQLTDTNCLTPAPGSGTVAPAALEVLKTELSELGAVSLSYDDEDPEGARHIEVTPSIRATDSLFYLLTGHGPKSPVPTSWRSQHHPQGIDGVEL